MLKIILILLLFSHYCQQILSIEKKGRSLKKWKKCIKVYCLPNDYNKLTVPFNESGQLEVTIDLNISQILDFDDVRFTVTLLMFIGMTWEERRLIGPTDNTSSMATVDNSFSEFLWLPGLWFLNKTTVFYLQETRVTFWCPMRFKWFPMDRQICKFQMGSFLHERTTMTFNTRKLSYEKNLHNNLLDYSAEVLPLSGEDLYHVWDENEIYSLAGFEMRLKREATTYFVNYFIPSGLFVVVSWVSFLIPPNEVSGRLTLLVTLFLVLIHIFTNVMKKSPNVEGLTAISAWVLSCILFVFGALTGYTFILIKKNRNAKENSFNLMTRQLFDELWRIDSICLLCFPAVFILFNAAYWPTCLFETNEENNTFTNIEMS